MSPGSGHRFRIESCSFERLTAPDLLEPGDQTTHARASLVWVHDFPNPIQVLFLETKGRAGLTWGGAVEWTDAESIEDAVERYFGIGGKELSRKREAPKRQPDGEIDTRTARRPAATRPAVRPKKR